MEHSAPPTSLAPAVFAYAAACVVSLAALPHLQGPMDTFASEHSGQVLLGQDPLQGLLWGLGAGAILAGAGQVFTRWTAWGRRLDRLLKRLLGGLHPTDAVLLAALSSLAEELVFRGLLLPYAGLAVSAGAFGLAHLVPRRGLWPWSVWAVAAGFGLGWLALASGGLLAPIAAHFLVNAVGLLMISGHPG
ncbi:MAG: CPBP family intramembrane metalloprotease [Deferrisomatales bacterium]|nr:CPBP family intramembrane metalloprotease [Deferrisomatales bacterium]